MNAFGDATLLFVLATDDQIPDLVETDPTLEVLPSMLDGRAMALGVESFRIDRYSAADVVDRLLAAAG